jgi:DNA recombination protein RmuC
MVVIVALVVLGGGLVWLARMLRGELTRSRTETTMLSAQLVDEVDRRLSGVDKRLEGLDGRLLATQKATGETETRIVEKIGKLEGAAGQMLARANDLANLEKTLRPPKARGGVGELLLENLLRDHLPPSAYSMQHRFDSGEIVDAVVRVGQLIPVDAKFVLDNFERLVAASTDDERTTCEKAFARDVRTKIDDIARKYIRPGEGTFEFAFMYVPAESVYYEIACGRAGDLLAYAQTKRVFPVSPTTFTAYLQVIVLGLRGMKIEERAQEVLAYVSELGTDFGRFKEDFDLVGTHLGRAQSKFAEADKRLDKFETKLERANDDPVVELEAGAVVELAPRAADAA